MDGWLDADQPEPLVEAINSDGERLGWMTRWDAALLRYTPQVIETPDRYLGDPYVWYHAQLISERGFLQGKDLNDVQIVLLSSAFIKRRKAEIAADNRKFEEEMFVNNPDLYRAYMDRKKQTEDNSGGADVEQRVPGSVEEFLATLAAFSEGEDEGRDKGQEAAEGWLTSFLSDDDLDQMDD